jgi:hypothetical protein
MAKISNAHSVTSSDVVNILWPVKVDNSVMVLVPWDQQVFGCNPQVSPIIFEFCPVIGRQVSWLQIQSSYCTLAVSASVNCCGS